MKNNNKKAIILGAGPAGLAFAYELIKSGLDIKPVLIEKLSVVGGLSRTVYFDGLGVDIGGHRLYTQNEYIKKIWDYFLEPQCALAIDDIICNRNVSYSKRGLNPELHDDVMLKRRRFSSIIYNSNFFDYPLKISFDVFKKLGFKTSFLAGLSYIKSMFLKRNENSLEDFMINRFGEVLYKIFFKDYTKKVWGFDASELSSEWGHQRIRKLSLLKTMLNPLFSRLFFWKKDHSLIDEFYYPKYGCSQLWDKIANYIVKNGGEIIYNAKFIELDTHNNKIISLKYEKNNEQFEISGKYFISSIPIKELIKGIDAPYDIKQNALSLPYRDYILVSFFLDDISLMNCSEYKTINNKTRDCWIYLQEPNSIASRVQIMNNWSPYLVGDCKNKYLLSLEFYANKGDDLWRLSDDEIIELAIKEAEKYNLFNGSDIIKTKVIREENAYPTYYGSYEYINKIRKFLLTYNNLYLIGRNGQHKYNNMDEAMLSGINAVREIIINDK